MANEILQTERSGNKRPVMGGLTEATPYTDGEVRNLRVNDSGHLLVESDEKSLSGAGTDGTIQLTGANTWVQVPDVVPTSDYVLVVSKENEAGTIRWSFDNSGTPSTTNGNKFTADDIIFDLAASEVVYFGSTDAGDDINWTAKIK